MQKGSGDIEDNREAEWEGLQVGTKSNPALPV